jgi:hypothetical protein
MVDQFTLPTLIRAISNVEIERTLDYYHASLRLTTISECLKILSKHKEKWLKAVRSLLKQEKGWGRVMRSISKMQEHYGIRKSMMAEFRKAGTYLRNHRRFMSYASKHSRGLPIGSGIVESACKQIVSERMKLSGMRWKLPGMRDILKLRSILLSQTWKANFEKSLLNNSPVEIQYSCAA